ncbi:MAG TPA: SDR family oxidoreductase [Solirubrobacteraceae bacterium]|jgi:NAD(P)-dependent dehydrogenase (short-subunit alcohol dehydrogenase family)|nr:SDR family oxidoreductase [Solirubrobacteraceae bacterium]
MISPSERDNGKVAIITGASQGIGAGLSKAYRERGYAVIVTARSIGQSEDSGIVALEGDIADPDTAQRVVDAAIEHFGRIDTLINNAGLYIGKPFTEYTLEDFNALIAVNLVGFFHITKRTVKHMLDKGHGHVVNVSTTLVEQADSGIPAALSVLTKGGLVAVTKSLAIEYASRGLRVNAVSLGVIKTPIHDASSYAGMGALHPVGRVGEIEDVVGGVLYLESAPFVTGEVLHIDGGQSAGH